MSSFVIDKKEYIKAAGVVAGIAAASRDFWVFNYEKGRNSTTEDYYHMFCNCYHWNAFSVQFQYNDPEPEDDPNNYMDTFNHYCRIGKQYRYKNLKAALIELSDFFRSALYQVEDKDYSQKMELFFSRIIGQIIQVAFTHDHKSWGTLELEEPTEYYETII